MNLILFCISRLIGIQGILMSQHICLICRVNNVDKTNVLYGVIIVVDSLAKSDPESF